MTLYAVIFYVLAVVILASTLLAIIQRQVIHAVVYLIVSFFATGLLFYLLGAPFLAALEVIIYAGAIMVLFLFIVMTVRAESGEDKGEIYHWLPAVVLAIISFFVGGVLIFKIPGSKMSLNTGMASPATFGQFLFKNYWFPVEIASFLLLIGLVGALYLGRQESKKESEDRR
ncbi:MAG TPA: NADH-quinone oxidoreductase subunit J [Thermodesulfobacteriota bacterium]|nr:NADH-quinone oxidoreductase subunit J [Thermodesulfobacteriota bacterium]